MRGRNTRHLRRRLERLSGKTDPASDPLTRAFYRWLDTYDPDGEGLRGLVERAGPPPESVEAQIIRLLSEPQSVDGRGISDQ